ncbi:MAG: hypothetical protein HY263_08015, partial [Chloroflexi bacterium]|nr:hypothetical protein [Chloroflexota bacterium]
MRAIHLARSARRRLKLDPPILDASGSLDARDTAAARRVATQVNRARGEAPEPSTSAAAPTDLPPPHGAAARIEEAPAPIGAGDLVALAALDAVLHQLVEADRAAGRADLGAAIRQAERSLGPDAPRSVAGAWMREFAPDPPASSTADDAVAAELLVLSALNDNPAVAPLRELVDDRALRSGTPYESVISTLEGALGGREASAGSGPPRSRPRPRGAGARRVSALEIEGADLPLPARLREPMRHAPASLQAQLR